MKEFLKILGFHSISICIIIGGMLAVYAAYSNLSSESAGSSLTASKRNNMTNKVNDGTIPAGAVMAFNLSSCPTGWSAFTQSNGRTIIGAGNSTDSNSYNTGFTLLQQGGEYKHTLTVPELPSHSHTQGFSYGGSGSPYYPVITEGGSSVRNWATASSQMDSAGGSLSHNNIQPYIALRYCQKD